MKEEYKMGEKGIWKILGEDPNCDFGGAHRQPELGFAQGKYVNVLAYAKTLPGWNSWGSGGNLVKIAASIEEIPSIDDTFLNKEAEDKKAKSKEALLTRKEALEQELEELNKKL